MNFLKKIMSKKNKKQEEKEEKFKEDVDNCNKEIGVILGKYDLLFDITLDYRRQGVIPNLGYLRKSEVEQKQKKLQEQQKKEQENKKN